MYFEHPNRLESDSHTSNLSLGHLTEGVKCATVMRILSSMSPGKVPSLQYATDYVKLCLCRSLTQLDTTRVMYCQQMVD